MENTSFVDKLAGAFILTMRNVKTRMKRWCCSELNFYINYEECKENKLSNNMCFYFSFYINYEECKELTLEFPEIDQLTFILTMRNVKFTYKDAIRLENNLLY